MDITSSVEKLKGVGAETAKKLAKLGVNTVYDLLTFWPRRYEDYSHITKIADVQAGVVTVKAKIISVQGRYVRRGMHITEAVLQDDSSAMRAVWFNQPYREKYFKKDQDYYFSGKYDFSLNHYSLQNPSVEAVREFTKNTARIVAIYRQTKGLDSRKIRLLTAQITSLFSEIKEYLPDDIRSRYDLLPIASAARQMHWPESSDMLDRAKRRIAFDELFVYTLANLLTKSDILRQEAVVVGYSQVAADKFVKSLPFKLTDSQRRASWEILQDIGKQNPMNRLLEGDVGAGKTVVATFAAYLVAGQQMQTAFLAPTELLAKQHADTLVKVLKPLGVEVALLTSSVKPKPKAVLLENLEKGKIDIIVGTHALIQDDVEFKQLALVIVDEQHRFGVSQRQQLLAKSDKAPHLLSMTATPIPRTLALTVYGELDISLLTHKPADRLPIKTKIWPPSSRDELYRKVDQQIASGRQVYVVCPLIDDSGDLNESKSVMQQVGLLKKSLLKNHRIEALHGKMKAEEKDKIMADFAGGSIDILVSTTVIEVGIDVPNANIMIIESAERFGLAQLHQLRGRVGRGSHQSYCYLLQSGSEPATRRLRAMESTSDGFKLAELDLELRGPGAVYGVAQHGRLDFSVANVSDTKLIKQVREVAEEFIESGQSLASYPELESKVLSSQALTSLN